MSKTFVEPTMTEALILWAIITLIHSIIAYKVYRTVGDKHLEKNTKEILENHIDPDEEIIDIEQGAIPKYGYFFYGPVMNLVFACLGILFWKNAADPGAYLLLLSVVFLFYHSYFFHFFIKYRTRVIVFTNKSFVISLPQNKIKKILLSSIEKCEYMYFNKIPFFFVYYKQPFKKKREAYLGVNTIGKITNYINTRKK